MADQELTGPCLGCMFFGTRVPEERSFDILDHYLAAGGTWLDTANNYAQWIDGATGDESEELLNRWLTSRGVRDQVTIATKIGARKEGPVGLAAAAVRPQVEGSLRRLGVDRIDLLYAHVDDTRVPLEETLGAFGELVREGLVAAIGGSNFTLPRLQAALGISDRENLPRFVALQNRATYVTGRPNPPQVALDDETLAVALQEGIVVLGYGALLAGAYVRPDQELDAAEYRHSGTDAQIARVHEVAVRLGVTPNQVVLAWLEAKGVVPMTGVSRIEQLDEALAPVTLDAEALIYLNDLLHGERGG